MGIDDVGLVWTRPRALWSFLHALCVFAAASLLALALLLSGGCASTPAQIHAPSPPRTTVAPLSDQEAWQPWVLHSAKRKTEYTVIQENGEPVVHARAVAAASGLMHRLELPVSETLRLQWRWKVEELMASADLRDRSLSDSPVRIVLAFDGDKSTLPGKDQAFFERVKLFAGHDMPYATLMYVWDNRVPVEEVISNGHTSRVRKIVASSGAQELKKWCEFQRVIAQDFQRAFGEKPGKLLGIALLTDSDNTGETTSGWYAEIKLLP